MSRRALRMQHRPTAQYFSLIHLGIVVKCISYLRRRYFFGNKETRFLTKTGFLNILEAGSRKLFYPSNSVSPTSTGICAALFSDFRNNFSSSPSRLKLNLSAKTSRWLIR